MHVVCAQVEFIENLGKAVEALTETLAQLLPALDGKMLEEV